MNALETLCVLQQFNISKVAEHVHSIDNVFPLSPTWRPHVFLTSKDHQNLDVDVVHEAFLNNYLQLETLNRESFPIRTSCSCCKKCKAKKPLTFKQEILDHPPMVANYVSPTWCPHVFLTSKNHQNLDVDVVHEAFLNNYLQLETLNRESFPIRTSCSCCKKCKAKKPLTFKQEILDHPPMVANYVSPTWCPHVLLTSKNHQNLDVDVVQSIKKYKKSDLQCLELELI